nr:NrfD/PsrC family molybdoenzyme membrane anchor subunit [Angustibacter aerolatus]
MPALREQRTGGEDAQPQARRRRPAGGRAGRRPLADVVGRLQALHARRLPRRLPDRRPVPHRHRHGRRAAGHLQRLRLLRAGLPVRRHRPAQGRRSRVQVHAVPRPHRGGPDARLRDRLPDPVDPVRPPGPACARPLPRGSRRCTRAASRRPGCTSSRTTTASAAPARSSCCSTSRRSTACRPTRWCRPATSGRCGGAPGWLPSAWSRPRWSPSPDGAGEPRRGEETRVPEADFRSYYGRPILKEPTWEWDIPAYLFTGGLAAGSSLLAAGGDASGRHGLRRATRWTSLVAVSASAFFLVHDLGRPARFHHMLRVAKVTSPMSVGTWILTAFGPASGIAALAEARRAAADQRRARCRQPAGPGPGPGRRRRRGRHRARARDVHRGAAHRHLHARLEGGARRAAVRLRRQRAGVRRRRRAGHRAPRRERPGAPDGRRGGRRRAWPARTSSSTASASRARRTTSPAPSG